MTYQIFWKMKTYMMSCFLLYIIKFLKNEFRLCIFNEQTVTVFLDKQFMQFDPPNIDIHY